MKYSAESVDALCSHAVQSRQTGNVEGITAIVCYIFTRIDKTVTPVRGILCIVCLGVWQHWYGAVRMNVNQ